MSTTRPNTSISIQKLAEDLSAINKINLSPTDREYAKEVIEQVWSQISDNPYNGKEFNQADDEQVLAVLHDPNVRKQMAERVKLEKKQATRVINYINAVCDAHMQMMEFMKNMEHAGRRFGKYASNTQAPKVFSGDDVMGMIAEIISPHDDAQFNELNRNLNIAKIKQVMEALNILSDINTGTKINYNLIPLGNALQYGMECREQPQNKNKRTNDYAEDINYLNSHTRVDNTTTDLLTACDEYIKSLEKNIMSDKAFKAEFQRIYANDPSITREKMGVVFEKVFAEMGKDTFTHCARYDAMCDMRKHLANDNKSNENPMADFKKSFMVHEQGALADVVPSSNLEKFMDKVQHAYSGDADVSNRCKHRHIKVVEVELLSACDQYMKDLANKMMHDKRFRDEFYKNYTAGVPFTVERIEHVMGKILQNNIKANKDTFKAYPKYAAVRDLRALLVDDNSPAPKRIADFKITFDEQVSKLALADDKPNSNLHKFISKVREIFGMKSIKAKFIEKVTLTTGTLFRRLEPNDKKREVVENNIEMKALGKN